MRAVYLIIAIVLFFFCAASYVEHELLALGFAIAGGVGDSIFSLGQD